MKSRHVIVTGASRGLGEAVVRKLSKEGWSVSFGARSLAPLMALKDELSNPSVHLFAEALDVTDSASVESFFNHASEFSGIPDAVVHCAGVYGPFGPTHLVDPEIWMSALDVNLRGTLLVLQNSIKVMLQGGRGRIVALSGGGRQIRCPISRRTLHQRPLWCV